MQLHSYIWLAMVIATHHMAKPFKAFGEIILGNSGKNFTVNPRLAYKHFSTCTCFIEFCKLKYCMTYTLI